MLKFTPASASITPFLAAFGILIPFPKHYVYFLSLSERYKTNKLTIIHEITKIMIVN